MILVAFGFGVVVGAAFVWVLKRPPQVVEIPQGMTHEGAPERFVLSWKRRRIVNDLAQIARQIEACRVNNTPYEYTVDGKVVRNGR